MSKVTLNREEDDMRKFQEIADLAIDNYGIITSAEAISLGVAIKDMCEWVHNGRLEKVWRGVYRLAQYPFSELCHYAEAVALVGKGSWIYGESVLAMHDLALVNPLHTMVATTQRIRKTLPKWIRLVKLPDATDCQDYNGIPCQNLASALIEAKGRIMEDRLRQAIIDAHNRGLLDIDDDNRIRRELRI